MRPRFRGTQDGNDIWARFNHVGMGLVRVALLFGSAAIAFALILTPILERRVQSASFPTPAVDRITTSSVNADRGHIFTVRRSVLRPGSTCVIRENGTQSGTC